MGKKVTEVVFFWLMDRIYERTLLLDKMDLAWKGRQLMVGVFMCLAGLNKTWASGIGGAVIAHLKMLKVSTARKVCQLLCSFWPDFAKTVSSQDDPLFIVGGSSSLNLGLPALDPHLHSDKSANCSTFENLSCSA